MSDLTPAILGVMSDTRGGATGVAQDTPASWYLTREAVERAKRRLNARTNDDVAARLGLDRRTFYRLLEGTHDIRLSKAMDIAQRLGWPLTRIFERGQR